MTRSKSIFGLAALFVLGAIVSLPLRAQPNYPTSPTGKSASSELVVPPGIYTSFVFACDGAKGQISRATLKCPTGELAIVVSGGETIIVPMPNWSLGQPATVTLAESAGASLVVSAITTSGPIKLEHAKK